jgi:beta-mannosidase
MFDPAFVEPWVDVRRWNDQWLTKSVRFHPLATDTAGRNDVMTRQVRLLFGEVPGKLDDFILASQAAQAEAMKFFVEFWRQGKGPRQGIIWWNLRDGWPILSDAVVDYYNRKKLAYDYIQSAQRDVQAICAEAEAGRHPVVIMNDTLNPATGHVVVRRVGETAPLLSTEFEVAANGKTSVGGIPQPGQPEMWQLEWQLKDGSVYKSHYLAARPPIRLDQYREWMKQLGIRQP